MQVTQGSSSSQRATNARAALTQWTEDATGIGSYETVRHHALVSRSVF